MIDNNINEQKIDEIKNFISRGNSYSGAQEVIEEWTTETLKELGFNIPFWDIVIVTSEIDNKAVTLQDFVEIFYDKVSEGFINVLKTED